MAVEMQLGGQIRDHREAMGLSQDDLAGRIFVSRQTVSNWETGRTYPDVQNLLLLGNLFGITLDELVKGDVETMNEEIKRNGRKIFVLLNVFWVLFAVALMLSVISAFFGLKLRAGGVGWMWGSAISDVLIFLAFILLAYSSLLQRKADIFTYEELLDYMAGKEVDRSDRYTRLSTPIMGAVIIIGGLIVGIIGAAGICGLLEIALF